MSKYCKHLTLQSELDFLECSNTSRLMQAVNVILIDGQCPINAMPTVIGGALFGALLQLIVLIQDSLFSSILQSLVALFRWNGTYCRGLLARCGLKACKLFEVVARRGRSLNCISHTCVFLTDYLIASSSGSVFIEKCGGIMRVFSLDSADWILCSTLLSSVSGAFRTLDSKIILDDDASCASRFLEDHVVPLLNEQLNAFKSVDVDEANLNQLEAFALMLKVLRDLQMIERYLQIKLNIDEQISWAVQMCKAICGRKRKLSNAERVYQNGRLIGAVVDFLTNQSRRDCLLKWKWLTSIVPYHKDVVERILSDATVDELQCLLRGDMAGYSEQRVLEVCAVIGSLQNDKKRRALLELFDPILRMMVNVVVDDARIVFMLLRSLFSQACGITNERRLLSLTLSFISVSLPSLDKADMIDDKYGELLIEISDTLSDCLRWCSSSVTEDQCALYAQLFVRAFRAVGLYALSSSFNAQLMVRNAHAISSVAYAIASHRTHFARIAPFIISECLSGVKYAPLAVHHLFGICDRYSIALLSTNLPPAQKRHFAQVYSSFYKANELTV
ncbi:hypothetical protein Tcan_18213 [Toxocara canis]|nr:hypothetical protein Tcan_18213 [Toxocara canis]